MIVITPGLVLPEGLFVRPLSRCTPPSSSSLRRVGRLGAHSPSAPTASPCSTTAGERPWTRFRGRTDGALRPPSDFRRRATVLRRDPRRTVSLVPSSPGGRRRGTVPLDGGCSSGFGARSRIRAWESESRRGATDRYTEQSSSPASPGRAGSSPASPGRAGPSSLRLVPLPRPRRYRRGTDAPRSGEQGPDRLVRTDVPPLFDSAGTQAWASLRTRRRTIVIAPDDEVSGCPVEPRGGVYGGGEECGRPGTLRSSPPPSPRRCRRSASLRVTSSYRRRGGVRVENFRDYAASG